MKRDLNRTSNVKHSLRGIIADAICIVTALGAGTNISYSINSPQIELQRGIEYNLKTQEQIQEKYSPNIPQDLSPNSEFERQLFELDKRDEQRKFERQLFELDKRDEQRIKDSQRIYVTGYTSHDKQKAIEALYAEARGCSKDEGYLRNIASTFVTRALEKGKSISEVIGERKQYSYLNKNDKNRVKSGTAESHSQGNILEQKAYERCQQVIEDILENGIDSNERVNHYFVRGKEDSKKLPNWARKKQPKQVIAHGNKITRFYYIEPNN